MTESNEPRIDELLNRIETCLVEYVPQKIRELGVDSEAYCVFLWYHDFSMTDFTPEVGIGTVDLRDACMSGEYASKLGSEPEWCVWVPQQSIDPPIPGFPLPEFRCEVVSAETNECYSHFIKSERYKPLQPFRSMLCRVAQRLNAIDWNGILTTNNDFFVFATDFIGYNTFDDLPNCIDSKLVESLEARKVIPN